MNKFGNLIQFENKKLFFGNKLAIKNVLSEHLPNQQLNYLKQVHGHRVVVSSAQQVEADCHWSEIQNQALCLQTADCIPVLFAIRNKNLIAAAHAGWRGVEKYIVPQTISFFLTEFVRPDDIFIFIGPYIQQKSFAVGNDVADLLMQVYQRYGGKNPKTVIQAHPTDEGKKLVDLGEILVCQILSASIPKTNIQLSSIDTYTDENYFSFRRQGEKAGRQVSLIYFEKNA